MKKALRILAGVTLLALSLFFVAIVAYLGSSEIMPAIRKGTLNVETSTMILNRTWEGNEIYWVLAAYLTLAFAFGFGAIKVLRRAFVR